MLINESLFDPGDGLTHFFITQGSWENPHFFLDHWGKPLFTLLSSTFAQFGYNGLIVFNIAVYFLSVLVGHSILTKLNVNGWLQLIFPIAILCANDYTTTILAGLTEPLFNLFLLVAGLTLIQKKWLIFALVVSLLPFLRSEGQLPIVLALAILIYHKQFRIVPFLATGFLIYAFIGWVVLSDFWWYFTQSPYHMDNDIYGKGTWDHYLSSYRNYIGNPGLYILILGFPSGLWFFVKRRWENIQIDLSFFAYGTFLGVVVLHSYFWATGQNGSIGLTRIATQGMPLFLIVNLGFIGRWNWTKTKISSTLFLIGSGVMLSSFVQNKAFIAHDSNLERLVDKAAVYLKKVNQTGNRCYFSHPFFAYRMGENPMIEEGVTRKYYAQDIEKQLGNKLKPKDIILWDSHFGPSEMGLPLDRIEKIPELVLVKQFSSGADEVRIFQYLPKELQVEHESPEYYELDNMTFSIAPSDEYTDLWNTLNLDTVQLELSFDLTSSSKEYVLAFQGKSPENTFSNYLSEGKNKRCVILISDEDFKLFFWNPKGIKGTIFLENISWKPVMLHPFVN